MCCSTPPASPTPSPACTRQIDTQMFHSAFPTLGKAEHCVLEAQPREKTFTSWKQQPPDFYLPATLWCSNIHQVGFRIIFVVSRNLQCLSSDWCSEWVMDEEFFFSRCGIFQHIHIPLYPHIFDLIFFRTFIFHILYPHMFDTLCRYFPSLPHKVPF